jgi:plasmid stabilization system protein ParE
MMEHVSLRPQATAEIKEAYRWYEERRKGLGREFLEALRERLTTIEARPRQYPRIRGDIRRAGLHRFPYSILFIVEPEQTVVLACFHAKRDPKIWHARR